MSEPPVSHPAEPQTALRNRLRTALTTAMKARDTVAVAALRSALAAIDNAEAVDRAADADRGLAIELIAVGVGPTEVDRRALTPAEVHALVQAKVAERQAAADDYERVGQSKHAARLRAEAGVLAAQLGKPS